MIPVLYDMIQDNNIMVWTLTDSTYSLVYVVKDLLELTVKVLKSGDKDNHSAESTFWS